MFCPRQPFTRCWSLDRLFEPDFKSLSYRACGFAIVLAFSRSRSSTMEATRSLGFPCFVSVGLLLVQTWFAGIMEFSPVACRCVGSRKYIPRGVEELTMTESELSKPVCVRLSRGTSHRRLPLFLAGSLGRGWRVKLNQIRTSARLTPRSGQNPTPVAPGTYSRRLFQFDYLSANWWQVHHSIMCQSFS
jgi:hypothetical protein